MNDFLQFSDNILDFFGEKGWQKCKCCYCDRFFLSKEKTINCGCKQSLYKPIFNRKKKMDIIEIKKSMDYFFNSEGYSYSTFPNIKNEFKDTSFIVAAVQKYNVDLKKNYLVDIRTIYSPQACIRLREAEDFNIDNGYLHAFINAATLKIDADFELYCKYIDDWISFLSKVGVHASRLKIIVSNTPVAISKLYHGWNVDIMFDGLELGHCSYFNSILSTNMGELTGIDCGFCLERICWVVNGKEFFSWLIPNDIRDKNDLYNKQFQELLRVVVLIIMSGVCVGNKNDSYQLKKVIYKLNSMDENYHIIDNNINYYYSYWSNFVAQKLPLNECKRILYRELRKVNIDDGLY